MIETLKVFFYKGFGLNIQSDIRLPELTEMSWKEEIIDVVITQENLEGMWNQQIGTQKFITKENLVMFQIPNTATFCVQEGNKIIVSPMKGYDEEKARLYVLGTCMGALLLQRKILPLHGSVIGINGKAYAFIGDRGAGKSTIALAFLNKGFELLSDDVIPVSFSQENIPLVTPSYPQQKLWQESLEKFDMDTSNYRPLYERQTKFAVPVRSKFSLEPLPLAGVFELVKTEQENVQLTKIDRLQRLQTLFRHTYRNVLIQRLEMMEWHFKTSLALINQVEMYQLCRPINRFTGLNLVDLVLESLKKEEIQ